MELEISNYFDYFSHSFDWLSSKLYEVIACHGGM